MKENFKIASVIIGTIVGAGLASGQEVLQFFSLYGKKGFIGIIICCIFYIFFLKIIIKLSIKNDLKSYKELTYFILGRKLGALIDFIISFFLFGGNVIMLSGGAALLNEYLNIPKTYAIFIMSLSSFIMAIYSTKGLVKLNSIIVPFSSAIILLIGASVLINNSPQYIYNQIYSSLPIKSNFILSSILYASFNTVSASGVLCPLVHEYKEKKHFISGCTIGSIVLTILVLIINLSIIVYAPKSYYFEIPNLYLSKVSDSLLPPFVSAAILLEMFSTEISDLYSIAKAFQFSFKISYINALIIIILFSIPFAFIGFSNLINILYPAFGAAGILFCAACMVKYDRNL
ncbi:MAG TPA: transporter [Clostridiaceae bacterium]|jgi:uncharacterized membrane protein YkvI|nr:transporter [Clostridiaceae bacterium]